MITQVEVSCGKELKTYWIQHYPYEGQVLKPGYNIILAEEGVIVPWTIERTFVSVSDEASLPPASKRGTLLEITYPEVKA